jgi:beta-aspartyl-dipeptidase (metallo-type)
MTWLTLIRGVSIAGPSDIGDPVDVLVAADRIAFIGATDDAMRAIAGAGDGVVTVVDAHGLIAIPGLVDAHVHLSGGGGENGFSTRVPRRQLSDFTRAGVTTAVGLLGTDGITRTMRDLVATTLGLREEGLSAWCYTGNYAVPVVTLTGSVRDDIVFCDPILGVGELALSDHRSSQPTFDEFLRIASDAYVAGLAARKSGVLHIHMGDGTRGLAYVKRALETTELPARVFQPTHLNRNRRLLVEAMELAAARSSAGLSLPWFDLTAFPAEDCDGDTTSAADAALAWWRAGLPMHALTISSDGGGCLPVFDACGHMTHMGVGRSTTLLETLRALVAGGMPLGLAAALMGHNPSNVLMLSSKGRLAPGYCADIALLDSDLQLSALMARGKFLFKHGAVLPSTGLGTFEKESA